MKNLLRRYREEDDGNMAILFAVSAVTVIGVMGAAMDYTTLSNAHSRSQAVADQTALAAAVYVRDHGRAPIPTVGADGSIGQNPTSTDGYLDKSFKVYNAAELGYEFKGWVNGGAENVSIEIEYDDVNSEVRTKVYGSTNPTFIQVLGKQDTSFSAESTAKYQEIDFYDPATVVMVLDNSGSMAFDDKPLWYDNDDDEWKDQVDAQPRLAALQSHTTDFMTKLNSLVGDQSDNNKKVLRTGMLAYNANTIGQRTVVPQWNTTSVAASLSNMVATGGTNSAPPINTARTWMANEDTIHSSMHGKDPLKFVIFMTDGVNNSTGNPIWVQENDTGQWYGLICSRYNRRGSCRSWKWDTVESVNMPSSGYYWQEGSWVIPNPSNDQSVADCNAMKNNGVKVYTIGFALEEGNYKTNGYYGDDRTYVQDEDLREQAYSFLADCASEPETFLTAENASELEQAFERIGDEITEEIIRLSN